MSSPQTSSVTIQSPWLSMWAWTALVLMLMMK